MNRLPFRLGSTSYVYPDDIIPNVRQLGPFVDDVELVLFDVGELTNLPDRAALAELQRLARDYDLTYTVHLPLDLHIAPEDPSLELARRIAALTSALQPYAYVAHLDARRPMQDGDWPGWREACLQGCEELGQAIGAMERLCLENLERWPHEEMYPLLERLPVSFCLDIGHLWLQGLDAPCVIGALAPRMRVVHLHGIAERDHKSLVHTPAPQLATALDALARARFSGVLTLEVFAADDFFTSRELVLRWQDSKGRGAK